MFNQKKKEVEGCQNVPIIRSLLLSKYRVDIILFADLTLLVHQKKKKIIHYCYTQHCFILAHHFQWSIIVLVVKLTDYTSLIKMVLHFGTRTQFFYIFQRSVLNFELWSPSDVHKEFCWVITNHNQKKINFNIRFQ